MKCTAVDSALLSNQRKSAWYIWLEWYNRLANRLAKIGDLLPANPPRFLGMHITRTVPHLSMKKIVIHADLQLHRGFSVLREIHTAASPLVERLPQAWQLNQA
jgi:hypothetical protein